MDNDISLKKGAFFVIEGIDGAGKSSQIKKLEEYISGLGSGYDVIVTKEPTEESEHGRKIRESMYKGERFSPEEELLLFTLDRREHLDNLVNPALREGKIVICDRYYYSNIAYQGASGLDPEHIRRINEEFATIPDAVFYLKIGVEGGLHRIQNVRNSELTSFEKEDFLLQVSHIFDSMDYDYFHTIDATRTIDDVSRDIIAIVSKILNNRSTV